MELLLILIALLTVASPVLMVVFFVLYMMEKSKVKTLEAKLKETVAPAPSQAAEVAKTQVAVTTPVATASVATPAPVVTKAPAASSATVAPVTAPETTTPAKAPTPKKFSGITITFGVGVLLLTIVAAVFVSSSWGFIGDIGRVVVLLAYLAIVFGLSFLSDKVLHLKQTGFAFYTLGSFLFPIIITGIGVLNLFGDAFSISAGNGALVGACAALSFGICGVIGTKIYKKNSYYAVSYLGFTWAALFIAGQIGGHVVGFALLGVIALVFQIINCLKKGVNLKYFSIYRESVTYIAAAASFAYMFSDNSIPALIGTIAVSGSMVLLSMNPRRSWVSFVAPIVALTVWGCTINLALDYANSYAHLICGLVIVLLYIAFFAMKRNNYLTDFLYPLAMVLFAIIADNGLTVGGLISIIMAATIMANMSWRKNTNTAIKVLAAIIFSWMIPLAARNAFALAYPDSNNIVYYTLIAMNVIAILSYGIRFVAGSEKVRESRLICESMTSAGLMFTTINLFITNNDIQRIVIAAFIMVLWLMLLISIAYKRADREKPYISTLVFATFTMISSIVLTGVIFDYFKNVNFDYFTVTSLILMNLLALVFKFMPDSLTNTAKKYMRPLGIISITIGTIMLCLGAIVFDTLWVTLLFAVINLGIMYLYRFNYLGFISMAISVFVSVDIIKDLGATGIVYDLIVLALFVALSVIGHVFHKKYFAKGIFDWFSLIPVLLMFTFNNDEFSALVLALFVLNFIGRTKTKTRTLIGISSIFMFSCVYTAISRHMDLSNSVEVRLFILMMLSCVLLNRYVIKPFSDKAMRIIWFIAVSLALVIEGFAALFTGYITDLLITGITSVGIFITSFIIKRKLWFTQSLVAIILIGLYFSITFGSSIVWLIYLLLTGVILITIAAVNEGKKRKTEKNNLTSEWKW
ncbi:MAG: hypothetical protein MJ094_04745 [Saccharofermentans sp.]|nr:hypothetical protein [Saccharofermentans sp.]